MHRGAPGPPRPSRGITFFLIAAAVGAMILGGALSSDPLQLRGPWIQSPVRLSLGGRDGHYAHQAAANGAYLRIGLWTAAALTLLGLAAGLRHRPALVPSLAASAGLWTVVLILRAILPVQYPGTVPALRIAPQLESVRVPDSLPAAAPGDPAPAGHAGTVLAAAFSLDGRLLASAGEDGTLRVWEVATRRPVVVLQAPATSLSFLTGNRLVAGDAQGRLRVWNTETVVEAVGIAAHGGGVLALAASRDGKTLASAGGDDAVRLWEGSPLSERARLQGHEGAVTCVALTPDGARLASGGADGRVRVWNAADRSIVRTLESGSTSRLGVQSLAFSPDGRWLVLTYERGGAVGWETATWTNPVYMPAGGSRRFAFSPDGTRAVETEDEYIHVLLPAGVDAWKRSLGGGAERIRHVNGKAEVIFRECFGFKASGPVRALAISPDGATLATAGEPPPVWAGGERSMTAPRSHQPLAGALSLWNLR